MKTVQKLLCMLLLAAMFLTYMPAIAFAAESLDESAPGNCPSTAELEETTEPSEDPYAPSLPAEEEPAAPADPYMPSVPVEEEPENDPYAPSVPVEEEPTEPADDPYAPSVPVEEEPTDPYVPSMPIEENPTEPSETTPEPTVPEEETTEPSEEPADEPSAIAEIDGSCGEDAQWSYNTSTKTLTISGSGATYDFAYNGQPWSDYLDKIQRVVISNGITYIGDYAFCMCTNLTSVQIPGSVTQLGEYAFYCCSRLSSITLPSGLTAISKAMFYGCSALTSIQIPGSVTTIDSYAFEKCSALTSVTVPASVSSVGDSAFSLCTGLESVSLPASLNNLGGGAFNGCASLSSITLPTGISAIKDHTFYGCYALTSIEIPANIKSIDYNAFAECTGLETILFKGNAPQIHEDVFYTVVATAFYPIANNTWTSGRLLNYGGSLTWSGYGDAADLVPAKITKYTNFVTGLRVTWEALPGAYKYELWRSETGVNGTYTKLTTTTALTYMDKTVRSGVTYSYRLVIQDHSGNRSKNGPGSSHLFLATPDFTLRVNRAVGVGLAWNKIPGATGYAVYRKGNNDAESWVRIATINDPNTLTYNDTSVKSHNGTIYKYTVRAFGGAKNNILSGCYGKGKTMVRLTSLTMTKAVLQGTSIAQCTWTRNAAATGYEVRLVHNGTVAQMYTIGNNTTRNKTFTGLSPSITYTAQVRSYYVVPGVGSFYSAWSTPVTVAPYALQ